MIACRMIIINILYRTLTNKIKLPNDNSFFYPFFLKISGDHRFFDLFCFKLTALPKCFPKSNRTGYTSLGWRGFVQWVRFSNLKFSQNFQNICGGIVHDRITLTAFGCIIFVILEKWLSNLIACFLLYLYFP